MRLVFPEIGQSSIVSPKHFWTKMEAALGAWEDVTRLLKQFNPSERHLVASRVQIVAFWSLFIQRNHAMPNIFSHNIMDWEHLACQIHDPKATLAEKAIRGVLISIFVPDRKLDKRHIGSVVGLPPFVSPYGPSVLECGFSSCGVQFYDTSQRLQTINPLDVRERRTKHLQQIFGIENRFTSQTGLPKPTKALTAPTSYHNTVHINIARTWAALSLGRKRAIADEVAVRKRAPDGLTGPLTAVKDFIEAVRFQICAQKRRGDIYSSTIEDDTSRILPSFLDALRVASGKMGLYDPSGLDFVHDWTRKYNCVED